MNSKISTSCNMVPAQTDRGELFDRARTFAQKVENLLESTVAHGDHPDLGAKKMEGRDPEAVVVATPRNRPIQLNVESVPLLRLDLRYHLEISSEGDYTRIERSTFQVRGMVKRVSPFFRYDFEAHPGSAAIPTAHLNVYGHRDDLLHAMYVSNKSRSRPANKKDLDPKEPRGLHMLHFPIGGTRFHPCLEDILEFVIHEFGIDTTPGWQEAINAGRAEWRRIQLASAIQDDPETARRALAKLEGPPRIDEVKFTRY